MVECCMDRRPAASSPSILGTAGRKAVTLSGVAKTSSSTSSSSSLTASRPATSQPALADKGQSHFCIFHLTYLILVEEFPSTHIGSMGNGVARIPAVEIYVQLSGTQIGLGRGVGSELLKLHLEQSHIFALF